MRDRIAQPCHTFQAQRQPVAFHRDSIPAAYRTVAARLFPAERFAGIESAAALWPLAATGFSANTSRVRHGLRMTAMGPEGPVMKKLHRSYRRLKNETAHGFKPKRHLWSENVGYPHPPACRQFCCSASVPTVPAECVPCESSEKSWMFFASFSRTHDPTPST